MDLWLLLAALVGTYGADVNAAAYFNGHVALVNDYEFTPLNLKGQSPVGDSHCKPAQETTAMRLFIDRTIC